MDCTACHHANVDGARFCAKCGALLPLPSADAGDSLIGQIVGGRYRVTQLLGEGGMGRVYLAEQQMGTNVRKVAVKTLQTQYAKDSQILARFHRECGTVSELEHPNTIQFFDFGQTPDGQLYIAMEYVQGKSLAQALEQQGPMAADRVLRIFAQVCGSLEEAHGRGVVHRDLKPDNVILSVRAGQPDFVKVLDFGIAKRSEARDQTQEQKLTQQGMVLGTPPYMSPEQFTGKELDPRSDIYSLGVMAYELLTGRLPYHAETPWEWATQHMTAQPFPFEAVPSGAHIPLAMKGAILRALSKHREERQSTVRQFYEELAGSAAQASAALGATVPAIPQKGTGTAAMPAPPGFAGPSADAGGSLAGFTPNPPVGSAGTGTAANPVAYTPPAQMAYPPQGPLAAQGAAGLSAAVGPGAGGAAVSRREKSRKGLIIGLSAGAGVLGLVVVLLATNTSPPPPAPFALTSATTTATATAPPPPPTTPPAETPPPTTAADLAPGNGTIEPPPPPQPKTVARTNTGTGTTAPKPESLSPETACKEGPGKSTVRELARHYSVCNDAAAKQAMKDKIGRVLPGEVNSALFRQACNEADAMVKAAEGVGLSAAKEKQLVKDRRAIPNGCK